MNPTQQLQVTVVLISVSLILAIVSQATAAWAHSSYDNSSIGLWQLCLSNICRSFWDLGLKEAAYVDAVRAFSIMSMIFQCTALALTLMAFKNQSGNHRRNTSSVMMSAGVFMFIAMIVFSTKYHLSFSVSFGYSFYLGWINFAFSFLIAGFIYCFKERNPPVYPVPE
ncbi:epithelial membrane protein 1-like [Clavelina lepadiformis]|uniref:Uncharacterized protein n=1 Tax=Clavelina lepadiformis TaxID=159417 RepID=A0ABP0GMT9_CLALP